MWQFFSSAFDRNKGAFDRRRALRLCKGSVLARRRAVLARSKNVAVLCKCVRPQQRCVRPQNCTASLSEGPVLARRRVMSSHAGANVLGLAAVRSTASTAFDRTVCSLNFPEPEQNAKNNLKKIN
jgi:methyl coenzyme M reductase subunit C